MLKLIAKLGETGCIIGEELKGRAHSVDKHYIPTRYPNASEIIKFIAGEKERNA